MFVAIARLLKRGLIALHPVAPVRRAFGERGPEALYAITTAGREFCGSGAKIKSGKHGKRNGIWRRAEEPAYAKIWTALRIMPDKRASTQQLVEAVGFSDPEKGIDIARKYLKALLRAGVVIELRQREPGFAMTSNGFKRFAIVRDLGPRPPLMRRGGLIDPNRGNAPIEPITKKEAS
ncbi:MAG TPA: hypothetical protein VGG48_14105 [Rhizomicrobium sp.]